MPGDDVGDSGYGVPYNVEAEKIEFLEHDINFIMAIETGGMFDRLVRMDSMRTSSVLCCISKDSLHDKLDVS